MGKGEEAGVVFTGAAFGGIPVFEEGDANGDTNEDGAGRNEVTGSNLSGDEDCSDGEEEPGVALSFDGADAQGAGKDGHAENEGRVGDVGANEVAEGETGIVVGDGDSGDGEFWQRGAKGDQGEGDEEGGEFENGG